MTSAEEGLDKAITGFSVAYIAVSAALVIALFSAYWSSNREAAARESAALAMEVVREQRALAQEISALLDTRDEAGLRRLRIAAATFARRHEALLGGDQAIGLAPRREVLTQIWHDEPLRLHDHAGLLIQSARRTADGAPPAGDALIMARDAARGGVDAGLAAAINAIRAEGVATAARARRIGRTALSAALAAVLLAGGLVFRPLLRQARRAAEGEFAARRELARLDTHDGLTDLPNRTAFRARLDKALSGDGPIGLCQFQIADLGDINRVHGEARADAALIWIARTLDRSSRVGDFVARAGAGDFRLIQTTDVSRETLESRCHALARALSAPMDLGGVRLTAPVVAAATLGKPGDAAETLIREVEIALAEARQNGPGAVRIYGPDIGRAFEARIRMEQELKTALEEGQFEPFFQPQICARSGAFLGFEALARWRHPRRGLLSPADFLYVAAEIGYGDALDEAIMEKALDELLRWRRAGLNAPRVSINFASDQLADPYMIEKIRWAAERRDLDPSDICVEILETVLMDDEGAQTVENIKGLARAGFALDLDDFGTGHASIAALRQFPVKRIKIDRSFVRDVDSRDDQRSVVTAMIELAHSLNVEVVAEGVETEQELKALQALDCDVLQGFLISRPLPAREAEQWARAYAPDMLGRSGAAG